MDEQMPIREKFSELLKRGWSLHRRLPSQEAIIFCNDDGDLEYWFKNDGHASYGIVFEGHDYEFASSNIDYISEAIKEDSENNIRF